MVLFCMNNNEILKEIIDLEEKYRSNEYNRN